MDHWPVPPDQHGEGRLVATHGKRLQQVAVARFHGFLCARDPSYMAEDGTELAVAHGKRSRGGRAFTHILSGRRKAVEEFPGAGQRFQ
jgi:hypothetical protein